MLYIIALVASIIWALAARKFWDAWRKRRNPVSLALFFVVLYCLWIQISTPFYFDGDLAINLFISRSVGLVIGVLLCLSFYWASLKWTAPPPEVRKDGNP